MAIRFTNCILTIEGTEIKRDLTISPQTGKILSTSDATAPSNGDHGAEQVIDLGGRLLAPGMIDIQLNGALGFDFSTIPEDDSMMDVYERSYRAVCRDWVKTGVTSFLPTIVTNPTEAYKRGLRYLAPDGYMRDPSRGMESLGAHCEGPFIHPKKRGAHSEEHILSPPEGIISVKDMYGKDSLQPKNSVIWSRAIRKVTIAPELPGAIDAIRALTHDHGVICSIGHSTATYEQGLEALSAGASVITHLFNAMEPFLHRAPGLVGLISAPVGDVEVKPYFGLITDDIHLSPSSACAAWTMSEDRCILTTDATASTGLPDGTYDSRLGVRVAKRGKKLVIEGTDTVAGGAATLLECVNNLIRWTGLSAARVLKTVTETPARMLGCLDTKGKLQPGTDADLVVFSWAREQGQAVLKLDQVWKFGVKVFDREEQN